MFDVPDITRHLLSVQKFAKENNVLFEFDGISYCVEDQFHKISLLKGGIKNGLYTFDSSDLSRLQASLSARTSPSVWHQRLVILIVESFAKLCLNINFLTLAMILILIAPMSTRKILSSTLTFIK